MWSGEDETKFYATPVTWKSAVSAADRYDYVEEIVCELVDGDVLRVIFE